MFSWKIAMRNCRSTAQSIGGICHPTQEHFVPLLVAAGAASAHDEVSFPVEDFELGSLSMRSVQFG